MCKTWHVPLSSISVYMCTDQNYVHQSLPKSASRLRPIITMRIGNQRVVLAGNRLMKMRRTEPAIVVILSLALNLFSKARQSTHSQLLIKTDPNRWTSTKKNVIKQKFKNHKPLSFERCKFLLLPMIDRILQNRIASAQEKIILKKIYSGYMIFLSVTFL